MTMNDAQEARRHVVTSYKERTDPHRLRRGVTFTFTEVRSRAAFRMASP